MWKWFAIEIYWNTFQFNMPLLYATPLAFSNRTRPLPHIPSASLLRHDFWTMALHLLKRATKTLLKGEDMQGFYAKNATSPR